MQLPGTSLDPHGPVAFWGWSSGGQPSASAAELAPSYTAEVNLGAPRPPISPCCRRSSTATELHDAQLSTLTNRGVQMASWSQHICQLQTMAA